MDRTKTRLQQQADYHRTAGQMVCRRSAQRPAHGNKQATNSVKIFVRSSGAYRSLGYAYLSPLPGAEYCSPQTRFILVRFKDVAPSSITNLAQCIQVTGFRSGSHAGVTRIANDLRTVIFQMSTDFLANELVTVK